MADGGGAATRGFVIQALVAILESLGRDTWTTMTVEPDLPGEKVDIQWRRGTLRERHSQVKHRSSAVEVSHVRRWAKALRAGSPDADCVLHVVGPASRGVIGLGGRTDEVEINTCGHDIADIRARCRVALHELLDARGVYGRSSAALDAAVDRLAGVVVVKSTAKFGWTPDLLWEEAQRAVAMEPADGVLPDGVRWSQTRIIEIEASGDCVETHITTYVNEGASDLLGLGALVRVTDSETTLEQVWDPDGEPGWKAGVIGVPYTVWVQPRGRLAVGGTRHVGVRVRRRACAEVSHPVLHYADTALPPEASVAGCPVSTWVVLPPRWHGASIEAPQAEVVLHGLVGFRCSAESTFRFRVRAEAISIPTPCLHAPRLRHLSRRLRDPSELAELRTDVRLAALLGDALL